MTGSRETLARADLTADLWAVTQLLQVILLASEAALHRFFFMK
jgi:hypothetical protein